MERKQIELLNSLAQKLKSEKSDRARVVASLQSAKILTKQGKFTRHLKNLDKVFVVAE